jgi:hypothetical protein
LARDQLICVSTGKDFVRNIDINKNVERKANWSRIRRQDGTNATQFIIESKHNPNINVDPFGPSMPVDNSQYLYQSLKSPRRILNTQSDEFNFKNETMSSQYMN